ncbi:ABC transporter substrate-binding protein [Achromobacter marplatensis]|jgi:ABC-type transport system substrate-binding protein|uniref:ABC transporter substrate-binding protein n=1 Tax=Achromobacter marplatensis TaxID=470868 RepID=J4QQF3_9BURK|nr:ABC transporter substrate-binding protein [Achromobacter marplatensis]EJO30200.1 extracellular solute-binding protein [Achromobacter marplatensis]MDH2054216.1 ABC transporter substrate-binding protein [Achromobacter marplatensis]OWT67461.1 ABC transporter substrate-binding protein [Achromobacter marplatensis]RBP20099.1 ABC-type transport system substrate-binding protein [Achromobacter marplatensis]CAB3634586.1 Heme-binding protein A [Achromobacter marplatensis]
MQTRSIRIKSLAAALALTAAGATAFSPATAHAEKVLRIGMTAGDIPRTLGQPDQGFEGNRFTGIPMYDGLTQWDLSKQDGPSVLIPGLALSWDVDAADKTKWVFKLRPGVKFHDGSDFNADAVVWNVGKVLDKSAPQFDPSQVGVTASRMPTLVSARKIDDLTVELTTSEPDSFLPINLTNLYMASPAQWQKKLAAVPASVTDAAERSQKAWAAFAADAAGTGPFKMAKFVPRERLEVVKYDGYWDEKRRPKIDRVVMLPLPEANSRTAALMSGQVDWIEAPAPDAFDAIKARGFVIYSNEQPHVWPWQLSFKEGSPWLDQRVRQAANLCVNRGELKQLLGGMMAEPKGTVPPGHPWWGNPKFDIRYDPDAARKLMAEAGYSKAKPVKVKVQTSASGSGQMQPLPMNEFVQQNLKDCYFDVSFDVVEWNTLFTNWRKGAKDPSANGSDAINVSFAAMDPFFAIVRFVSTKTFPPTSNNWGYFGNAEIDGLIKDARTTFTPTERDAALAKLHARVVEEAPFVWIAHDVGPRAMSPKVKGVVQPKSWFIDIATMSMD